MISSPPSSPPPLLLVAPAILPSSHLFCLLSQAWGSSSLSGLSRGGQRPAPGMQPQEHRNTHIHRSSNPNLCLFANKHTQKNLLCTHTLKSQQIHFPLPAQSVLYPFNILQINAKCFPSIFFLFLFCFVLINSLFPLSLFISRGPSLSTKFMKKGRPPKMGGYGQETKS